MHCKGTALVPSKFQFVFRESFSGAEVTCAELAKYMRQIGLEGIAYQRCSRAIALQLRFHESVLGLNPKSIVREIAAMEGSGGPSLTKPESSFVLNGPLSGLWHKHFFFGHPSVIAANALSMSKAAQEGLARAHFAEHISEESIALYVEDRVTRPLEWRAKNQKLTGEWIVFVRIEEKNYYLGLASHSRAEEDIKGWAPIYRAELPQLVQISPGLFG
ncbi:hypothetical protein IMZ29_07265 [Achromobacter sp. GG226]|uniref:hypothetical protein n=1 Tax=Verticiella alkaliphila TaxID=2779529 RepID=UPI001C0D2D1A|nr:hypothetical protein [Verticiella sp. GG226]MBU4610347.1 hypothetical protein [Verticiella sp. GG226]